MAYYLKFRHQRGYWQQKGPFRTISAAVDAIEDIPAFEYKRDFRVTNKTGKIIRRIELLDEDDDYPSA